jgi:hypothetical protein
MQLSKLAIVLALQPSAFSFSALVVGFSGVDGILSTVHLSRQALLYGSSLVQAA